LNEAVRIVISLLRPFTLLLPLISGIAYSSIAVGLIGDSLINYAIPATLGCISLVLANFVSNCINASFDTTEDRNNPSKKDRPVASGKLSKEGAMAISMVGTILMYTMASYVNIIFVILLSIVMMFSIAYSVPPVRLKRKFMLNYLCIAVPRGFLGVLVSVSIVSPMLILNPQVLTIGIVMFAFVWAGNPLKDATDVAGDIRGNIVTYFTKYGVLHSFMIIASFMFIPMFIITIASIMGVFPVSAIYMMFLLVPVTVIMAQMMAKRVVDGRLWVMFYILSMIYIVGFVVVYAVD